jgi:hypothetical protein
MMRQASFLAVKSRHTKSNHLILLEFKKRAIEAGGPRSPKRQYSCLFSLIREQIFVPDIKLTIGIMYTKVTRIRHLKLA